MGGTYINQSGTDVVFSVRHDLIAESDSSTVPAPVQARMVGDVEYLSSFPYREAFSSNFNQAVSSDVVSTVYATREWDGMAASLEGDRYQGEKRVASTTVSRTGVVTVVPEAQVRIFHAPALEFSTTDHTLGSTGLEWNLDGSFAALKRSQERSRVSPAAWWSAWTCARRLHTPWDLPAGGCARQSPPGRRSTPAAIARPT